MKLTRTTVADLTFILAPLAVGATYALPLFIYDIVKAEWQTRKGSDS